MIKGNYRYNLLDLFTYKTYLWFYKNIIFDFKVCTMIQIYKGENMIIAVEGMDGCGKSTIAKAIAKKFGYDYRAFPNKLFFDMDDSQYKKLCNRVYDLEDAYAKAWFFGFGNIIATKNIGDGVVIDRHFLSNYFWNGTNESEPLYKTLLQLVGKPDLTIVLYAGKSERMRRIAKRDPNDYDLKDPEKMVLGYDKMIDFAKKYRLPSIVINTEKFDLDKTTKICESLVSKVQYLDRDETIQFCNIVNSRLKQSNKEPYSKYL